MPNKDVAFVILTLSVVGVAGIMGGFLRYYHKLNPIGYAVIVIAMVLIIGVWGSIIYQVPWKVAIFLIIPVTFLSTALYIFALKLIKPDFFKIIFRKNDKK